MPDLSDIATEAKIAIAQSNDCKALDLIRIKFLGKKGYVTTQAKLLKDLSSAERPAAGLVVNQVKRIIEQTLKKRKAELESKILNDCSYLVAEKLDISLPGRGIKNGGLHPITTTIDRIEHFFSKLGFSVVTGIEIEDDYHNFDALNIPDHHPARSNNDTFWFDDNLLLRTHTSCVQIRKMMNQIPPIRIISPGRVYRKDHDQTHTPMFHQIEGFIIDTDITFANLKSTLHDFLYNFFEDDIDVRFRPSYFPFTQPSAEVDIMDKNHRWLEVLGCGMVHPNVFNTLGIDYNIYSGFAFGIGVERLAMLRYGINDLRLFFENDLRFLKQFK